jgi:hypothetical protein
MDILERIYGFVIWHIRLHNERPKKIIVDMITGYKLYNIAKKIQLDFLFGYPIEIKYDCDEIEII